MTLVRAGALLIAACALSACALEPITHGPVPARTLRPIVAILRQELQDEHNVGSPADRATFGGEPNSVLAAHAWAVCVDAEHRTPGREVLSRVEHRDGVGAGAARYFVQAAATLYCPGRLAALGSV